jgi:hypothetical protein
MFSSFFKLYSPLNIIDIVSHPYKTGQVVVLCILIYKFLERRQVGKRFLNLMVAPILRI